MTSILSSSPGVSGPAGKQQAAPRSPGQHRSHRSIIACFGLACVLVAELLPESSPQGLFAAIGLVALLVAAILVFVPTWGRQPAVALDASVVELDPRRATWRWTLAGLGLFGLVVAQTWFRSGTVIAGGDIFPPVGTAWIGRIFSTYGWSGNNLGGPQTNQGQLPLGALAEVVHLAGGSGALTQRIWLSLLIAGIMVAAAALARSLAMSPLAGIVAGFFFFFNPMTLSQIGFNQVSLAAMVLVAALPGLVISYGRGTVKRWQMNLGFVVAAPFVGFVYANPPLVGMLVLTVLATPLLVWARFGRDAAARTWWGVLIGGVLLIAASAYWLIPQLLNTSSIDSGTLSALSSWKFTEARSTLANAFWLNTAWTWNFNLYSPYAHLFRQFPLSLVRALIPLLAFFGLTLRSPTGKEQRVLSTSTRLAGLLSVFALGLILLSNGTNAPGSLIFDPLYHLPYGWLLREPGRFLVVVALGYALLIGLLIDRVGSRVRTPSNPTPSVGPNTVWTTRVSWSRWLAVCVVVVAMVSAFPLWTGSIVPGSQGPIPSARVVVPTDWDQITNYLNSTSAPTGSLLVLPADDFYQMPYTWYYGTDSFILNLLDRHVVVPSQQGYYNVSSELLSAVQLEDSALTSHNWTEASQVLAVIGTPILLVRGDIEATIPGRDIVSPVILSAALTKDPDMRLVHRDGHLSLYELNGQYRLAPNNYATTNSSTPDLRLLAVLPQSTALISSPPQAGHAVIVPVPPLQNWQIGQNGLTSRVDLPNGWTFRLAALTTGGTGVAGAPVPIATISHPSAIHQVAILSQALGPSIISNGTFQGEGWGTNVGNCNNAVPLKAPEEIGGGVVPVEGLGAFPTNALQLHASVDAACESTPLDWHGGNFLIRYWSRSLSGHPPRVCVWEEPIGRCAQLSSTSTASTVQGSAWITDSSTVIPDIGTQRIRVFVYADSPGGGGQTITQYTNIVVRSIPTHSDAVLIGSPDTTAQPFQLAVGADGYSPMSSSATGTTHVIVDGLRNGWLTKPSTTDWHFRVLLE
jgi:hypothetical protein